jgi:hypothetical protein
MRQLTLALSGRAMSAAARRGRMMACRARGVPAMTRDGPLERVVSWHSGNLALLFRQHTTRRGMD